ncbi:hypothetical protein F5Y16DRAFT_393378 [Xylariaceae sp. FL0255]|nr:hypothetical protein F5Y16DRAFT_393378 [Xylariaceae sp. FL0255]
MAAFTLAAAKQLAQTRADEIAALFEQDDEKRFQYLGMHGWGGQSSVHRVAFRAPGGNDADKQYLVMKTAGGTARADLANEKNALQGLRGCRHIVQIQNFYNDPIESSQPQPSWAYIYLELLENGTLDKFIRRYVQEKIDTQLPNRLLVIFFLCMIRSCIAMAWPGNSSLEMNETTFRTRLINETTLIHNDIHGGNMMFGGKIEDDPEHSIAPVLKLLDLGLATIGIGTPGEARQQNVMDMGIMMATIMCLIQGRKYSGEVIEIDLSTLINGAKRVETPSSGILEDPDGIANYSDPLPRIDLTLRLIVAACMATEPQNRPTLDYLENWIGTMSQRWDDNTFADMKESKEGMSLIMQRCMFDAPNPELPSWV